MRFVIWKKKGSKYVALIIYALVSTYSGKKQSVVAQLVEHELGGLKGKDRWTDKPI